MSGVFKSQVLCLCSEIDEWVGVFLNWLLEGEWFYLWFDVIYIKVCWFGWIVSVVVIVVVVVNLDGCREVLGIVV